MSDNLIRQQDEILQVMYWMRGEGLGEKVITEQLNRFLDLNEKELQAALEALVALGWICVCSGEPGAKHFQLTERGSQEGKRRFLDEFSGYLGKESHIECDDPDCDCHSPDWEGICHSSQAH